MPKTYFCSIRGNVTGPVPGIVITQRAATGTLGPEDLIRPADQKDWFKAEYVQGLFDVDAQSLMQANCPGCQAPLTYDSRFFGQRFKCARCLQVIEINELGILRLVAPKAATAQPVEPAAADPHPIKYKCQHCKAALETGSSMGMQEEPCPICKTVNRVPPSKEQQRQEKEREKAKLRHIREQVQRDEAERSAAAKRRQD
jgi:phage FluMu protein Com